MTEYHITRLSDIEPQPRCSEWGPWRLDPATLVLYAVEPYRYEVDLERCTTSAEVLDWICQIASKNWADDVTIAGLVRALNDVLGPQSNLCSCGRSKRISRRLVAELVDAIAHIRQQHPLATSPDDPA